jgi:hypothetical protein
LVSSDDSCKIIPNYVKYDYQGYIITLNISDKGITQVPAELGQLSYLQALRIEDNDQILIPPPEIVS